MGVAVAELGGCQIHAGVTFNGFFDSLFLIWPVPEAFVVALIGIYDVLVLDD
jgi:hypothetical protein